MLDIFSWRESGNEAGLRKFDAKHLRKLLRILMSLGTMPKMLQNYKTSGKHLVPKIISTGPDDDDVFTRSNHLHWIYCMYFPSQFHSQTPTYIFCFLKIILFVRFGSLLFILLLFEDTIIHYITREIQRWLTIK